MKDPLPRVQDLTHPNHPQFGIFTKHPFLCFSRAEMGSPRPWPADPVDVQLHSAKVTRMGERLFDVIRITTPSDRTRQCFQQREHRTQTFQIFQGELYGIDSELFQRVLMRLRQIQHEHPWHLNIPLRRKRIQRQRFQRRLRYQPPNPRPKMLRPLNIHRTRPNRQLFQLGHRFITIPINTRPKIFRIQGYQTGEDSQDFGERIAWCAFES